MTEALARLETDELEAKLRELQDALARGESAAVLRAKLDILHPADIAYVLESLPLEAREGLWQLTSASDRAAVLLAN